MGLNSHFRLNSFFLGIFRFRFFLRFLFRFFICIRILESAKRRRDKRVAVIILLIAFGFSDRLFLSGGRSRFHNGFRFKLIGRLALLRRVLRTEFMFRCGDRRYVLNVPFVHGVCLVLLGFRHGSGNGSGLIVLDLFNFHELRKVEFGFSGSILFFLLVQVLRKNRGPGLIRPSHIGRFLQFARLVLAVLFVAHKLGQGDPRLQSWEELPVHILSIK